MHEAMPASRLNPRTVAYRMTGHPQARQSLGLAANADVGDAATMHLGGGVDISQIDDDWRL